MSNLIYGEEYTFDLGEVDRGFSIKGRYIRTSEVGSIQLWVESPKGGGYEVTIPKLARLREHHVSIS